MTATAPTRRPSGRHGLARGLVVLPGIVLLVTGGAASAYWRATGSGAGTGATGAASSNVTLSSGTPVADLYPGGSSSVALTIGNPNDAVVRVVSLELDTAQGTGGFAVDGGHAGCDLSVLGLPTQSNSGSGWTVPARSGAVDGSLAVTLPGALTMSAAAADACQGATFTVYLRSGS